MARVMILCGLGFGDESKGSITDFLTRSTGAKLVVRYSGGANCGHNVVLPDGRHHCFSQFGSGTFVPGVGTHLSRYMLVNPFFMLSEEKHLQLVGVTDAFERMTIDREALVTNPFQVAANRLREMLRNARHGSCGMGIGETMADSLDHPDDALRVGDLENPVVAQQKLEFSQCRKSSEFAGIEKVVTSPSIEQELSILRDTSLPYELAQQYQAFTKRVQSVDRDYLDSQVNGEGVVIFEGAQGVLLDENYGFHPHTTWSTTTFKNADDLLKNHTDTVTKIGVLRAYMTRHGAGPFVSENPELSFTDHNQWGEWQQNFRFGHFDRVATAYALEVLGKVDYLALTHLDQISRPQIVCVSYVLGVDYIYRIHSSDTLEAQAQLTDVLQKVRPAYSELSGPEELVSYIQQTTGVPLLVKSYGPTHENKILLGA